MSEETTRQDLDSTTKDTDAPLHAQETAGADAQSTHESTTDTTQPPQLEFTEQHIFAALAYVWVLVFIPLLTQKDDPYVMYHVRQGLVVFGIGLLNWVVGTVVAPLWPLINIITLGLILIAIIGVIHALRHQEKPLPLIGSLASHIKI